MENRHMKKIRKVIKFLSKKLNILQEKVNMLYVAISILVVVAIQSMLTWKLAKDVMKDKQLRRMYYEKYGEKYKVKKEKRWWERG